MWVIDFETYFDDDYSLSKMTTEAYVRDPRFEVLGVGLHNGKQGIFLTKLEEIHYTFKALVGETFLAHHAHFDGLILSHHYGVKPAKWLDTLSMAQLLHGPGQSKGLGALAEHYNLPAKSVPYDLFKGKRWHELTPDAQRQLADGCLHDCELTYQIYERMRDAIPPDEFEVMDITIRMFTEPRLVGDRARLAEIRDTEWRNKNDRLQGLGVGKATLSSSAKFAALLEAEGVEVPRKPGKRGPIPAVAKSDLFMKELLENDDERLAGLAQARLDIRSTINETRAGRLLSMAERGPLCVYLHYSGAHTRRWSGGDALNFQNFPRGGSLRRTIRAPEGYLLACPDQSQGECRILNWLAGQTDVVERFRSGADPYLPIASKFYCREITKADTAERGLGKQLELACGFGCGAEKIVLTAARGTYGPPVSLTIDQGWQARNLYRSEHPMVVQLWKEGDEILRALYNRESGYWPTTNMKNVLYFERGLLFGPTGLWIDYRSLKWGEGEWRLYKRNGQWERMYGAKLVENVVQFLSRLITSQAMIRFRDAGYPIVGMSHDDVWLLTAEQHKDEIIRIMSQSPEWAPDLPLAAECKIGETYQ